MTNKPNLARTKRAFLEFESMADTIENLVQQMRREAQYHVELIEREIEREKEKQ